MENGDTTQQIVFDEKDPEYLVDELSQRVYFFPKKSGVKALGLGPVE